MVAKERRFSAETIAFGARSLNCHVARVVAQVGVLSYWVGLVLATLSVVVASAFAALITEPLAYRLLSVVILGILPGLAAWAVGWILLRILRIASVVCDLVVTLLQPKYRALVATISRITILVGRLTQGVMAHFGPAVKAIAAGRWYSRDGVIAAAIFYSVRTVRDSIVAYRYLLMAVTSPIRFGARILITLIPQQVFVAESRGAPSQPVGRHTAARPQFSTSHRHWRIFTPR